MKKMHEIICALYCGLNGIEYNTFCHEVLYTNLGGIPLRINILFNERRNTNGIY